MQEIPKEVKTRALLPECWVYENERYIHLVNGRQKCYLPIVVEGEEKFLKDLGISYRYVFTKMGSDYYEYWDNENFEERDLTLPLYVKKLGDIYQHEKSYTGKIPTKKSIRMAKELTSKVEDAMKNVAEQSQRRFIFEDLKKRLSGKEAVGLKYLFANDEDDYIENDGYLKILPVQAMNVNPKYGQMKRKTGYIAVFDVNNVELDGDVTMEVPEDKVGLFIGTGGWQLKEWCSKLGIRKINIVGIPKKA